MNGKNIKTASLDDLIAMKNAGAIRDNPDAPAGPNLGKDFWKEAKVVMPAKRKSVHLKLDESVYERFYEMAKGKGHLTLMQNVLKAYVDAHSK